jgi:transposase-like protein
LSLRKAARALAAFVGRSHEAVGPEPHRLASISGAFQSGQAKVAVADETGVGIAGEQAWVWLAMEPRSSMIEARR